MIELRARSPFSIAFRRCLRRAALPALAAMLAARLGASLWAPQLGEASAPGAMTPWLALPLLVIAAIVAGTAITLWPTFTARSPGADWIVRLQRGRLRGAGAVIAGALAAQLVLTLPMTTWLARALGAPTIARAHRALTPPASPLLAPDQPRLRFAVPGSAPIAALELRPLAALPGGPLVASRLRVRGDGEVLGDVEVAFSQDGQSARLDFAPRALTGIEIELIAGNVPLFFPAGAVTVIEDATRNNTGNGGLAAIVWLLPTFVALGFAVLCGSVAAMPTVLTVAFVLLFLLTVAGVGSSNAALITLLRGQWLPGSGIFAASTPSLLAGSAAMISAMLLRRRPSA